MHKIKLKRGQLANIPRLSLAEPAFTTDSEDLFVGGSSKNIRFVNASKTVTNVYYDSETGNLKKTIDGVDYDAADLHAMAEHDYPGVYSGFVTKDASGDIITIKDGADNVPLKSASFEIKPIQDLHGQDAPYPPGGGINIFPNAVAKSQASNGVTISTDGSGVYTLSGTATANTTIQFSLAEAIVVPPSSTHKILFKNSFANGGVSFIFANGNTQIDSFGMTPANRLADGYSILAGQTIDTIRIYVVSGQTVSGTISPMIVSQSVASDTPFAPYSNECPISGWTGAEIPVTGINVFDGILETGDIGADGNNKTGTSYKRSPSYFPAKASTEYYRTANAQMFFYDANKVFISRTSSLVSGSFTTPENTYYMRLVVASATTEIGINYPATDTDYYAYLGAVYPITWADEAGTVYGGKLNATAGELKVTKASYIVTSLTRSNSRNYYHNPSGVSFARENFNVICDRASTATVGSAVGVFINNNGAIRLNTADAYDTADECLAAFGGEFTVVADLATPLIYHLDPVEVSTLLGLNNIWCDIAPLDITYRQDTNMLIDNLSEHALNAYATDSESGEIASFSDGADGVAIKELTAQIKPVQDLHGQASPYPENGGKNKLPQAISTIKSLNTSGTWSGNAYTKNGVTTTILTDNDGNIIGYRVNGTATSLHDFVIAQLSSERLTALHGYTLNGAPANSTGAGIQIVLNDFSAFVALDTGSGGTLSYSSDKAALCRIAISEGKTVSNAIYYPMVSSEGGDFAPYSNICPISGYTGAEITRTGKQLFDKTATAPAKGYHTGLHLYADGTYGNYAGFAVSEYIKVKPSTDYTISGISGNSPSICFYDKDRNYLSGSNYANASAKTITSPATAAYCRVSIILASVDILQLEEGSTASPYEPYLGTTYSVSWSDHGTVYKGTLEYLGGGEWKVTPTHAEADLGSFDYYQAVTSATGVYRFQTAQGAIPAVFPPNDTTVADIISSNYKAITAAQTATPVVGVALSLGTRIIIYDESLKTATAADFKTAMSGVKLVYKLASPTSFTVTGPDPETLLGDNNIWSDTGDVDVSYRADTKLYIEKRLSQLGS